MKKLVYITFFVPCLFSCSGEESSNESAGTNQDSLTTENVENIEETEIVNSITITEGVVGIFQLGKPVPSKLPEELKMRQFIENKTVNGKSVEHTHNVVFNQLEDVVELLMDQGTGEHHLDRHIEEIIVISNYYETQEGIRVGSTVEEFQSEFENTHIWYNKPRDEYFIDAESLVGVQFILDPMDMKKKASGSQDMQELSFSYVSPQAEIKKIRMY